MRPAMAGASVKRGSSPRADTSMPDQFVLYALILLLLGLLARHVGSSEHGTPRAVVRAVESNAMLAVVFIVTFLGLWYRWGAIDPPASVHDEMAYVLQSRIFATGHWALPTPPLAPFWEQPHVLLQPALAAKYFPGHAIVLTLGTLLGWTALMPLVLAGTAGVLIVVLARRIAGPGIALATWAIWVTMPLVLYFGPSYYSEATSTVCWLAGWYALLEWRSTREARWLVAVGVCTGWCCITRPLTGVAYAIPVGIVVLRDVWQRREYRHLLMAIAAGGAVLAVIPLWSARTTGSWRTTPLLLYTRQYMPYDVPGFRYDTTPPLLPITPNLQHLNYVYGRLHVDHVPSRLPVVLAQRARFLVGSFWPGPRGVLMAFAGLGLFLLAPASAFAVASGVVLVLTYLVFAAPPEWSLYYYETAPAFAYLTATGLAFAISLIGRRSGVAAGSPDLAWYSTRWTMPLAIGASLFLLPGFAELSLQRGGYLYRQGPLEHFAAVRAGVGNARAILFVRFTPFHDNNVAFVQNVVDPRAERLWVVNDRGGRENARLMAVAPDRKAYIFDEESDKLFPYDPARVR